MRSAVRVISGRIGGLATIAVSILIAIGLSMIVRPLTATLNQTLGTVWPFSTVHCETPSAPGCDAGRPVVTGRFGLARR